MLAPANLTKQMQVPSCLLSRYMAKSSGWDDLLSSASKEDGFVQVMFPSQHCSVISISEGVQAPDTWETIEQGGGAGLALV